MRRWRCLAAAGISYALSSWGTAVGSSQLPKSCPASFSGAAGGSPMWPGSTGSNAGRGVQGREWTPASLESFHRMRSGARPRKRRHPSSGDGNVTDPCSSAAETNENAGRRWPTPLSGLADALRRRSTEPALSQRAVWHMRGRLSNPNTGQTIALIEGAEIVQPLSFLTRDEQASRGKGRKRDMSGQAESEAVESEDKGDSGNVAWNLACGGDWEAAASAVSRKFFAYVDPASGEPMTVFRHTPVSKRHPVRPLMVFEQVIRHVLCADGRLAVIAEWPDSRIATAETAARHDGVGGGSFSNNGGGGGGGSAAIGAWRALSWLFYRGSGRHIYHLDLFVQGRRRQEEEREDAERSRDGAGERPKPRVGRDGTWVAFGPSRQPDLGCKESYTYVVDWGKRKEDDAVMSYHRYGECPSWYGPGKMCSLDLQGRRVPSADHLPGQLGALIAKAMPRFAELPRTEFDFRDEAAAAERRRRGWDAPWWTWRPW